MRGKAMKIVPGLSAGNSTPLQSCLVMDALTDFLPVLSIWRASHLGR